MRYDIIDPQTLNIIDNIFLPAKVIGGWSILILEHCYIIGP